MTRVKSQYRQIKNLIYRLKRDFGVPSSLYRITESTVNRQTGQRTRTKTRIKIKYVPLLDVAFLQKFSYDISYLAANKNFTYGGIYEIGDRVAILDGADIPKGFEIDEDVYLVFESERYNIQKYSIITGQLGYVLHLRKTQKEPPEQIVDALFIERTNFTENFIGES